MFTDSFTKIFQGKKKVMCVFAHPDDAEIYAGGTIARLIKEGIEVATIKMTLGNKGSRQEQITEEELSEIRQSEDVQSMKTLGIKDENNIYLDFKDGEVECTLKEIEAIVRQIRKFKPDLIISHNPENMIIRFDEGENWVNHRDHRNTGKNTVDAAYPYSRDILFFPDQLKEKGLSSHKVSEFLFVDYFDHVDTIAIDVSDTFETRTKAIACHKSQYSLEDAKKSTDFFTKLDDSGKRYERFRYVVAD